ncbi:hypothetical protein BDZ91DRAFT_459310 [Kalaharituber pfeilii]|nr:hypothetical protein BDZ91DRAFT_459310 [Kalaharituber pfeilii]
MEAVGLAASIMALVDVAGKLIGYLNRVKYAKREATDMLHELQNMQAMLEILRMRIQERKIKGWAECTQILSLPDGPIAQIQTLLEEMLSRMRHREISFDTHQPGIEDTMNSPKQLGGAGRRNSWLNKLLNLDRYKQWVQLALADDHIGTQ